MGTQIEDMGAVIGYRPKLEYVKDLKLTSETNNTVYLNYNGKTTYSSTLTGFMNNLPSNTLDDINFVIETIDNLIDTLKTKFNPKYCQEYTDINALVNAINAGNYSYVNNFIDYHKHNISGSIVPELIGNLAGTKNRLKILNAIVKKLYYGDEYIPSEDSIKKDNAYVEQLKKYEVSDKAKINYVNLTYDAIFNRTISTEIFDINKKCIAMSKIPDSSYTISENREHIPMIEQLYAKTNLAIDYREEAYKTQQTLEIMEKTLYNYYDKRSNYDILYNMYNGSETFPLMSRLYEYQSELDKSIENIARTLNGNQYYLSEMNKIEQEKHALMQNYCILNYET